MGEREADRRPVAVREVFIIAPVHTGRGSVSAPLRVGASGLNRGRRHASNQEDASALLRYVLARLLLRRWVGLGPPDRPNRWFAPAAGVASNDRPAAGPDLDPAYYPPVGGSTPVVEVLAAQRPSDRTGVIAYARRSQRTGAEGARTGGRLAYGDGSGGHWEALWPPARASYPRSPGEPATSCGRPASGRSRARASGPVQRRRAGRAQRRDRVHVGSTGAHAAPPYEKRPRKPRC